MGALTAWATRHWNVQIAAKSSGQSISSSKRGSSIIIAYADFVCSKHRKAHDKRHKCTVCSRAFGLKTDLERHSNLHRFSQFIYKCHYPDCKFRGSRRKDHLSAHLKQHHTKNGNPSLGNDIPFEEHQRLIQHQQNVEFLECVRRGDKKVVERFLSENGSIQLAAQDSAGSTALHICSMKGHTSLITMLLKLGIDINVLDRYQNTALHLAMTEKKYDVVRILLENGVNVNAANEKGETALHSAAWIGDEALADLLIDNKADHEARCWHSYTDVPQPMWEKWKLIKSAPLHLAAFQGHSAVVGLLLGGGASVNSLAGLNYTPLHLAAAKGYSAVVGLLLSSGASVDSLTASNHTPLHLAARAGDMVTAKLLVAGGASVESVTRDRLSPLHIAVEQGHTEVAKLLLKNGAHVRTRDSFERTPLHRAAKIQTPQCIELLLEANAQLDTKDIFKYTPLSYAIGRTYYLRGPQTKTQEESTKLLLAARAKFSLDDWNYLSPEYKNMFAHYRPAEAEGSETSDPNIIPWIAEFDEKYADIVQRYSERGTGQ